MSVNERSHKVYKKLKNKDKCLFLFYRQFYLFFKDLTIIVAGVYIAYRYKKKTKPFSEIQSMNPNWFSGLAVKSQQTELLSIILLWKYVLKPQFAHLQRHQSDNVPHGRRDQRHYCRLFPPNCTLGEHPFLTTNTLSPLQVNNYCLH